MTGHGQPEDTGEPFDRGYQWIVDPAGHRRGGRRRRRSYGDNLMRCPVHAAAFERLRERHRFSKSGGA